ncbi:MAG: hypothetical protein AABY32_06600 [Nanoarchaeota archaeon]
MKKREIVYSVLLIFLFFILLLNFIFAQDETIKCYSHKDCPTNLSYSLQYWCDGNTACQKLAQCLNPGTPQSECTVIDECINCINIGYLGCKEGQCQKINCYKNEDCGESFTKKYCSGSQACLHTSINSCYNPGTIDSYCLGKGGLGCTPCTYGCKEGVCAPEGTSQTTNQAYPCGKGTDEQPCSCLSPSAQKPDCNYPPLYSSNGCIIGYKEVCESTTCKDSDGGINYYVKGSVMFGNEIATTDSCGEKCSVDTGICEKDGSLREESCVLEPGPNEGTMMSSMYKCPNGCSGGACIRGEKQSEEVKCIFKNTKTEQKCYAAEKNWMYCSSYQGTCIVTNLEGYDGEKITWKSSCGGYAYTTLDGNDEYAEFDCSNMVDNFCRSLECFDGSLVECYVDGSGYCACSSCSEIIVKPVCGNGICESGEWQVCEATAETCQAGEECEIPKAKCSSGCEPDCKGIEGIEAKLDEKFRLQVGQTVKIIDYKEIKALFRDLLTPSCEASTTNTEEVKQKLTAYVIEGTPVETTPVEIIKCSEVGPMAQLEIVNPEEMGNKILTLKKGEAKNIYGVSVSFLEYDFASRTGVFVINSKPIICPENCKCDSENYVLECKTEEKCEIGKMLCPNNKCEEKCEINSLTFEECKSGCIYGNKCLPIGVRVKGSYCSVDIILTNQLGADEKCENNFECKSNICIDSKCVSEGVWKKFISWFNRFFGGAGKETEIIDCGGDTECWENAFKVCQPAKISQQGDSQGSELGGMVIEIIGLEDEKCVVKWTATIEGSKKSMKCKFENYMLGKDMVSGSMEQYCEGELTYWLSSSSNLASSKEEVVQTPTA